MIFLFYYFEGVAVSVGEGSAETWLLVPEYDCEGFTDIGSHGVYLRSSFTHIVYMKGF